MHFGGEVLFSIFGLPFTNTMLSVLIIDVVLILIALIVRRSLSVVPGKLQSIVEGIFDFILGLMDGLIPKKFTAQIFPWLMTFFIFILLNNWIGLLPGMETIYIKENESHEEIVNDSHPEGEMLTEEEHSVPHNEETEEEETKAEHHLALLKGANADPNVTFALAIISFLFIHITVFRLKGGKKWFQHFFHVKGQKFGLAIFFIIIGLLEILLDPLKYMSLALRLFGNILAGEVLVTYMNGLAPVAAVPFMLLEVLVGFLQALIFTGLTVAFLGSMLKEDH